MSESLRDQLLKLGFVPKSEPASKPRDELGRGSIVDRPSSANRCDDPSALPEIDLASAYALRAKIEREEAEARRRESERKAQEKRERKIKLAALLDGKSLNVADAEFPRYFEHGGKIKRVYCTEEQIAAINAGELGIVMYEGRYWIVTREIALAVGELEPRCLVLLLEPGELDSNETELGPEA